ncbi:hypothetical protein KC726_03135 [Candidatus Woesebacteria bacterium]|nr:hypothetical protein [Candidatus Woesebacteria bacterium]
MKRIVVYFLLLVFCLAAVVRVTSADELDDINNQLNELNRLLSSSEQATAYNEEQLADLNGQLDAIKAQVADIEQSIAEKEADIAEGEAKLLKQKQSLDGRILVYYKHKGQEKDLLLHVLASDNLSLFLKQFIYQQNLIDDNRRAIVTTALLVKDIEEKKQSLQDEKDRLEPIKEEVTKQSDFLAGEVSKSKEYESGLRQQIVVLSARQQEILAQRLAALNIPRSAGTSVRGCSDDRGVDPGFGSAIAFFTYGAPHRKGLNQYGAKGRADAGQNVEQILSEYYPGMELKKDYDTNAQVNVDGYGTFNIEHYTKRIYEVPADWPMETLKAQAVAARTYALNSMQRNGHICTTESCQVFKPDEKGGRWNEAVDATRGWVLLDGGSPGFTQYASTHGGYILNLNKFDGRDGNPGNWGELNDRAYDKESPWFYCDWGARSEYSNTAWLRSEEVADIVNTLMLVKRDGGTAENLYQTDKPNPAGKETWSADKVKSELRARGGSPMDSISNISVSADFGSGQSTNITVNGQTFTASEFKDRFNLRAPANIQIIGPLFNVERK